MLIAATLIGDDRTEPEVPSTQVQAGNLQPWMLLCDDETGELHVVVAEPQPFQQVDPSGRPQRWVSFPLDGADEPEQVPATEYVTIVVGAELELLEPMLDADLLSVAQEALARNGLCNQLADPDDPRNHGHPPEALTSMWCGRPSDPDSPYRFCTVCDEQRLQESNDLVGHGFEPTYGAIAGNLIND